MTRSMILGIAAGAAVAATLGAAPAAAQQLSYAVATPARTVDAEQLEQQANELLTSTKNFKRAAGLLLRAAEARGVDDPMKVKDRSLAARLYYYAGDRQRAVDLLETTADHALATGAVLVAAELYLDASYVAQEMERGGEVLRLAEKTQLLMNSPHIDARDRARLQARFEGTES